MEEIVQKFGTTELVIMLLLGIVIILAGYRIKKTAFFIAWFLLGFVGCSYIMPQISQTWPAIADSQLYQTLIQIGAGVLVAMLGFSFEKLCVGGICFALTILASIQYFGTEMQTLAISAVVGVLIAGFAVMMMKPATIIATSGVGAYATTIAILMLTSGVMRNDLYWPLFLGLTAVGSGIQFMTTRGMS